MRGSDVKVKYYLNVLCVYLRARIIMLRKYKKKYLTGRLFDSVSASGWKYIVKFAKEQSLGINDSVPWPVSPSNRVVGWDHIHFCNDDMEMFWTTGTYFQAIDADIFIGTGTYIASNVGLITANHDIDDLRKHTKGKDIVLGERCWIGMNSVILPGVHLGDHTIVGAGSVVTKSFEEGNCVIVGNPAKVIKKLSEGDKDVDSRENKKMAEEKKEDEVRMG